MQILEECTAHFLAHSAKLTAASLEADNITMVTARSL